MDGGKFKVRLKKTGPTREERIQERISNVTKEANSFVVLYGSQIRSDTQEDVFGSDGLRQFRQSDQNMIRRTIRFCSFKYFREFHLFNLVYCV